MRFDNMTRRQAENEITRLYKNIDRRLQNVKKVNIEGYDINKTGAITNFEKFNDKYDMDKLKSYSDKDIHSMLRSLRYINNLKSSSVKGAKDIAKKGGEILNILEKVRNNKDNDDKISSIVSKLEELSNGLTEYFKYDIINIVDREIKGGKDEREILATLHDIFEESYERGQQTNVNYKLLFASKLKELL